MKISQKFFIKAKTTDPFLFFYTLHHIIYNQKLISQYE